MTTNLNGAICSKPIWKTPVGKILLAVGIAILTIALYTHINTHYWEYTPAIVDRAVAMWLCGSSIALVGLILLYPRAVWHTIGIGGFLLAAISVAALVLESQTASTVRNYWIVTGGILTLLTIHWIIRKVRRRKRYLYD